MTRRPGAGRSRTTHYAVALVVAAAAAGAQYSLQPVFGERFALATFPAAVLLAAWFGGVGPGLLTTVASAIAAAYLFLPPAGRFEIAQPGDLASLLMAVMAGTLISLAVGRLRRQAHRERDITADTARRLQQANRLQRLTSELLQARTPTEVMDTCLPELLHAADVSAGALFLVSDDATTFQLAHALGYAERVAGLGQRWSLTSDSPVTDAIRRRELVVLETGPARGAGPAAADPLHGFSAGDVVTPLVAGGRALGAVALHIPKAWHLEDEERDFLRRAGRDIAQALDRARLYEMAERARAESEALRLRADSELRERHKAEEALRLSEARYRALAARTSRLYALSAGLSKAVTLDAVAQVIVRQGKVVVGAAAGSVCLLVDAGAQFETLYSEEPGSPPSESRRFRAESGLCPTMAVETQRPVFVGSFAEWQEKCPRSASIAADGGYVSSASLPLFADGSVLGVLSFHFTLPVNFDDEYAALLTSVAQHCAQALDRARLYETAEHARAEAEAANQSKDDFLSTISHELRTPLNAMLGWAAMLRSGSVDAARTQRAIEAIYNNATRQGRLIEELLDVSRIVAGRASFDPQHVDLGANIRGAVEAMMPMAAAKGVTLKLDAPPGIYVTADPRRLEQVFLNLLSNAVKFTPRDGDIAVDVTASEQSAEVRVADSGTGIDPTFLPHVFERFRQADSAPTRAAGGLGLGLFISRQLVEAQGGSIRADSSGPGRGATFTVTLPAAAGASPTPRASAGAAGDAAAEPQPAMPSLDGVRVLLVDDEPDALEVMASALESRGATVLAASSARDAIETLTRVDVDLLLSDIAMPGQDGYELIRTIRAMPSARLASLPAAAVTAHARDDERDRALAAGFHMHLTKPVHPVALARAVATLAFSRTAAAQ